MADINKVLVVLFTIFFLFCFPVYADDTVVDSSSSTGYETPSDGVDFVTHDNVAALVSEPSPAPVPTEYPGITQEQLNAALANVLSNGVDVRLSSSQLAALSASSETAVPSQAPTIWNKAFNEYTPQEGYSLLSFLVLLSVVVLCLFYKGV